MQGTQVRALVWEVPTCWGATKPVHHNYSRAHKLQLLSPRATTTEARMPIACALQLQQGTHNEKPVHSNEDPTQPKN